MLTDFRATVIISRLQKDGTGRVKTLFLRLLLPGRMWKQSTPAQARI